MTTAAEVDRVRSSSPDGPPGDVPRRVLHVLDHSQPHRSGYAVRSNSVLEFQRRLGFEPLVLTAPKHGPAPSAVEEIGGIAHHRTDPEAAGLGGLLGKVPFLREGRQVDAMRRRIEEVARAERVELIHAHSPSLNGLPAVAAARRLGLPVVYEVRAFWEDAAVDRGTFGEGSLRYRLSRWVETGIFRRADAVTVICEGLRNEMVSRGVDAEKITVIPNGVDIDRFGPGPRTRRRLNDTACTAGSCSGSSARSIITRGFRSCSTPSPGSTSRIRRRCSCSSAGGKKRRTCGRRPKSSAWPSP